jgi:hypothetical protein
MHARPADRREPAWILLLAGWLAADALRGPAARSPVAVPVAALPDLARMCPRELRRLPGIGENLAIAIAEARWEHRERPYPLLLTDVPGIGERTAERVRAWLAERGALAAAGLPGRETAAATVDSP